MRRIGICAFIALASVIASGARSLVADDAEAMQYLCAALQAEADGDFLGRQQFLASAVACEVELAPLQWHQGRIQAANGQWISIDESVAALESNKVLKSYEQRRQQLSDSPDHHLTMARWCVENELPDQAQAHLERVIQFDTDHVAARLMLGYRLVGGEWVSMQAVEAINARAAATQLAMATFGSRLIGIRLGLQADDSQTRLQAQAALLEIDDPDCALAVESVFAGTADSISLVLVDWLAKQTGHEASRVLTRYACLHPSADVQEIATEFLRTRPLHDFVPELLRMMASPVASVCVPYFNNDGTLAGYRHAFAQEKQDKADVFVIESRVNRIDVAPAESGVGATWASIVPTNALALPENREIEALVRMAADMETATRQALVERQNRNIIGTNAAIARLLTNVTDREFTGDPNAVWSWWDEVNETEYQKWKESRYREQRLVRVVPRYQLSRRALMDRGPSPGEDGAESAPVRMMPVTLMRSGECFAAGTPVQTTRGLQPIESIVTGDMVFTRDTRTGALLTRPVLQATRRPPAASVVIHVGTERIQCTRGHLLWVSGDGWKKASELQPGDVLHAAEEPTVVTSVREAVAIPSFNLRVADTNTYFVGKSRVLSHDVTERDSNWQIVPGLDFAQAGR